MIDTMRNIRGNIPAGMRQEYCFGNHTVIAKGDNRQCAAYQNKCLVFFRVKVTMRPDIGAGLNGIQEAVTAGFIGGMKVVVYAPPRVLPGFRGHLGDQFTGDNLHLAIYQGNHVAVKILHDRHFAPRARLKRFHEMGAAVFERLTDRDNVFYPEGNAGVPSHKAAGIFMQRKRNAQRCSRSGKKLHQHLALTGNRQSQQIDIKGFCFRKIGDKNYDVFK